MIIAPLNTLTRWPGSKWLLDPWCPEDRIYALPEPPCKGLANLVQGGGMYKSPWREEDYILPGVGPRPAIPEGRVTMRPTEDPYKYVATYEPGNALLPYFAKPFAVSPELFRQPQPDALAALQERLDAYRESIKRELAQWFYGPPPPIVCSPAQARALERYYHALVHVTPVPEGQLSVWSPGSLMRWTMPT